MKRAGTETLQQLAPLLERLRTLPDLTERKPGTFYLRSSAFLHFHEDPAGVFADVKLDGAAFARVALHSAEDGTALFEQIAAAVVSLRAPTARR